VAKPTGTIAQAEPAAAGDLRLTAEMEGWVVVSHQPLAGGGWSRWPKAASKPAPTVVM
jgi:hypothetical protein